MLLEPVEAGLSRGSLPHCRRDAVALPDRVEAEQAATSRCDRLQRRQRRDLAALRLRSAPAIRPIQARLRAEQIVGHREIVERRRAAGEHGGGDVEAVQDDSCDIRC